MKHSKSWLAAAALSAALACGGSSFVDTRPALADSRAMVLPAHPEPLVVETDAGARSITIEVADEVSERTRGLMFRETMADDHGMLFVFPQQQDVGFWMKNTPMPLDLIFIAQDGTIRAVKRGEPFSEATISPGVPVRFVLELKAGTAERLGIEDGDRVEHPEIGAAPLPPNPAPAEPAPPAPQPVKP